MKPQEQLPNRFAIARSVGAKGLTILAFRNGPVEDMHAGMRCQACKGDERYSRLTNAQMKTLNKFMVDRLYELLTLKETDRNEYNRRIVDAVHYTLTIRSAWNRRRPEHC